MEVKHGRKFGRLHAADARDHRYLMSVAPTPSVRLSRYWYDDLWWGDQTDTPMCVGFAWAHFLEDSPVIHIKRGPHISPVDIYYGAQRVDEWEGENYDGTSVRAGAKYLHDLGVISEYRWAFDVDTMAKYILDSGPVVVGSLWFGEMMEPGSDGMLHLDGEFLGGHAYVVNGYSTKKKLFRMKNSWSKSWGNNGHGFIAYDDMSVLIAADGEIAMAVEKK